MSRWDGLEEAVHVADAGTFVGAARLLGLSTSHVSRAIAALEARLGEQLFVRTTRTVSLTDTGRILVEQTRRIIQEREELLAMVNGLSEPQGEIRLTCSIALGERFVSPIVRRYATEHTRVRVSLDLTNRLVDLVGEGYDLAIRTGTLSDTRLAGTPIGTRGLHVCAAPSYLESAGIPQDVAALCDYSCLIGTATSWHFNVDGKAVEILPSSRWRCNSGAAVLEAALAGMGICQLPDFYVRNALADGTLVPLLEAQRPEDEKIWAVYPRRRHLQPKVRALVERLKRDLPYILTGQDSADLAT